MVATTTAACIKTRIVLTTTLLHTLFPHSQADLPGRSLPHCLKFLAVQFGLFHRLRATKSVEIISA